MVQADLQQYRVLLHLNKIISSPLRCSHFPSPTSDSTVHKLKQRIWQFQQITPCVCSHPQRSPKAHFCSLFIQQESAWQATSRHLPLSQPHMPKQQQQKTHTCFKSVLHSNFTELGASGFINFCQPRYLTAVEGPDLSTKAAHQPWRNSKRSVDESSAFILPLTL